MYNLAIALASAVAAYLLFGFALGGGSFNVWAGILPGLILAVVVYLLLVRRTLKQIEVIMGRAQVQMMKAQEAATRTRRPSEKQMKDQMRRAIEIMKQAYSLKNWQFLIESQINAQIGSLLYAIKDFDDAKPYLKNSFLKNWIAQAMLAVTHFRDRDYDDMKEVFERAVKGNKKESLLWAIYAWCLMKNKDRDGAISVLIRAKEHVTDDKIEQNLLLLQNNKKMKMDGWKESWYQFHLAKPPQVKMQHPGMGKMSKKAIYR